MELRGKQKRALRALGHHLKPALTVGKQGVLPTVLIQCEENLLAHELIKVKVLKTCPVEPTVVAESLVSQSGAAVVQRVGRTLLLYRPHPEHPSLQV